MQPPTPALPAASRGQNLTPGARGRAWGAPSAAPRALPSAPAGDAKPEVIVKVEPEEEAYIGCPRGPGDPGAAGEHCRAGTRLVSASGCAAAVGSHCTKGWSSWAGRELGVLPTSPSPNLAEIHRGDPGPVLLPAPGAPLLVPPRRSTELLSCLCGQPQLCLFYRRGLDTSPGAPP